MRLLVIAGAIALALAGCQSTQESLNSAEHVCLSSGLKPGTKTYDRCVNAAYAQNRRQSEDATKAVALGAAAAAVGGAVIGASAASSSNNYYYGPGYYRPRCNRWGCW